MTGQWDTHIVQDGCITYPLAEFAYLVKFEEPSLQTIAVPSQLSGVYPDNSGIPTYAIQDYADFAEWLKAMVNQTIHDYHDYDWNHNETAYTSCRTCGPGAIGAINMQATMARSTLLMYLIYRGENNIALRDYYHHKTSRIATQLKNELVINALDNTYWWIHDCDGSDCWTEDIVHGSYCFEFAYLCHKYSVMDYDNNTLSLFDSNDMDKFSNTFIKKIYRGPLNFSLGVGGVDWTIWNYNTVINNSAVLFEYLNHVGRYVYLCQYNGDVYHIISDRFADYAIYGPFYRDISGESVANLAYYKDKVEGFTSYFNPIATERNTWVDSEWKGVASGDFNGDGIEDFASVRGRSGALEIHHYDASTHVIQQQAANAVNYTFSSDWAGIAAGNFITSTPEDEIFAINNGDRKVYLLKQTNDSYYIDVVVQSITSYTWIGLAAGNFDNVAGDEIVALRSDGEIFMYKYDGVNIINLPINNSSNSTYTCSVPRGIAVGNLDGNVNNGLEIITINNSNTGPQIRVFNYNHATQEFAPTIYSYNLTSGSANQWNGVTAVDFNFDGIEEIIAHRDYDGDFFTFQLDIQNGTLINNYKEFFPVDQQLGVFNKIYLGRNSNNCKIFGIVSLRNCDGNMYIYNFEPLPDVYCVSGDEERVAPDIVNSEYQSQHEIHCSPNPFNNTISITIQKQNITLLTLEIKNTLGQAIFSKQENNLNNFYAKTLDLSDQPKGVYFLDVTVDGERSVKKIVKQ